MSDFERGKPKPGFTLADLWKILERGEEPVYDGPDAYTIREIAEGKSINLPGYEGHVDRTYVDRCTRAAIKRGQLVRVKVYRLNELDRPFKTNAYVATDVYEKWREQKQKSLT